MLDEALLLQEAPSTGGHEDHHVSVDEALLDCQPDHCQSDHDQLQWPGGQPDHPVVQSPSCCRVLFAGSSASPSVSSGTGDCAAGDRRGRTLAVRAALLDSEAGGADLLGGGGLCMLATAEWLS